MVTIDEFLGLFPKATTRRTYRTALNQFHDIAGVPSTGYFNNDRTYEYDVIAYYNDLKARNLAPKSIMTKVKGAVRSYLIENGVELPKRFWKRLKISSYPITKDRLFTKEEMRMIFSHLDIATRSIVYSELSNGLRLDDTLQNILLDNLYLEMNPARFYYYNSKIERDCVAFLTAEAKIIIKEWLKIRESWCLEHLWIRQVYFGWTDLGFEEWWEQKNRSKRLFPFDKDVFYNRWWYALDCSGLNQRDKRTKRRVLHSQTFRKYFKSWVGTTLPQGVVECLIGHTEGLNNINTVYNLYGQDCEDALAKDFLKIEPLLCLGVDVHSENIETAYEQKLNKLQKELDDTKTLMEQLWSTLGMDESEAYQQYRQQLHEEEQQLLAKNSRKSGIKIVP
jgi:hypothetical protein